MPTVSDSIVDFNQVNRDAWVTGVAARLPAGTRILDVGAGQCRYRRLFAHCDYKAQDFAGYTGTATGELKEDWRYGELDYVCDAASIPVADGSFDAVLCTEVLEHVPEPVLVLREIGRILRPGGQAFISAPLGSGLHQQPYHYYGGFTPQFYRYFLPTCSLEVQSIEPNGRFFRLLSQELHRGLGIISQRKQYHRWQLAYWTLRLVRNRRLFRWLARLDDEIPVEEFTVGYHVEARKPSSTGGGCA